MEWNAKALPHKWENLINSSAKPIELSQKLQSAADWRIAGMGGADLGSFCSSGRDAGDIPGSYFEYAPSTKSSKSTSIGSPSIGEVKTFRTPNFATEDALENFCNRKELVKTKQIQNYPTLEALIGSGEPLLSLEIGKRASRQDASGRSSTKSLSAISPAKRSKSSFLSANPLRCQVEGCNFDLSSAKDYHRKHRVCESHTKCPVVVIDGLERRFCQQCSRFHNLLEFDEKKRSCRKRLSNHNARRRKPQPASVQLNSAIPYSSLIGLFPASSNLDSAQKFHSAFSLLSTSSGGSREPKPVSLDHAMNATPSSMHQPMVHKVPSSFPFASSVFRQCEQSESEVPTFNLQNFCSSHHQEFQEPRAPYEGAFDSCLFD